MRLNFDDRVVGAYARRSQRFLHQLSHEAITFAVAGKGYLERVSKHSIFTSQQTHTHTIVNPQLETKTISHNKILTPEVSLTLRQPWPYVVCRYRWHRAFREAPMQLRRNSERRHLVHKYANSICRLCANINQAFAAK